ncbi:MAG TPA: hypothetical protein VG407_17705 [Caulobacteraceae bacterium]|jgi:hypothetical protein|nr:hypothetical protein [Caulobacteraceae bacterium]
MTDDQIQSMRSDIAFLKELAVDGQRATSRVGGAILAAAGLCYATAAILHWTMATGRLALPPAYASYIWIGATVIFLALCFAAKMLCAPGTNRGPVNRANRTVWIGTGLGIFAVAISYFLASLATGNWVIMNLMASTVLAFYGAAWLVNAAMLQTRAPAVIATGCFIAAAAIGLLVNSANLLLAYAAALVLFALIPGLFYMRGDRASA